jgi:hypothetical protein
LVSKPYRIFLKFLKGFKQMNCRLLMSRLSIFPLVLAAALSGCGENTTSLEPAPLAVSPADAVAYNGSPVTLYISGGTIPYTATSSNSAVINVPNSVGGTTMVFDASNVAEDTLVNLDVRDSKGEMATSTITVKPSVISNTLTVTPDPAAPGVGCDPAVCSGLTALVTVQLKNMATPLVNRNVRFDVVQGDYQFITNSSATTFADTITATTDQNGYAHVRLKANVNAPTQYAILKVTDEIGGSVLQTTFTIAQYTDGVGILSVVPETHTITAYYENTCSFGARVDYLIYGGTPPYTVQSTSTGVATVSPSTVLTNGGGFTATTQNAFCPGTAIIAIRDATGRVIEATLENKAGGETVPEPVTVDLFVTSTAVTVAAGSTRTVTIGGSATPYYVSSNDLSIATASVAGATLTITGVAAGSTTVTVTDSKGAAKTINVTVTP